MNKAVNKLQINNNEKSGSDWPFAPTVMTVNSLVCVFGWWEMQEKKDELPWTGNKKF